MGLPFDRAARCIRRRHMAAVRIGFGRNRQSATTCSPIMPSRGRERNLFESVGRSDDWAVKPVDAPDIGRRAKAGSNVSRKREKGDCHDPEKEYSKIGRTAGME